MKILTLKTNIRKLKKQIWRGEKKPIATKGSNAIPEQEIGKAKELKEWITLLIHLLYPDMQNEGFNCEK